MTSSHPPAPPRRGSKTCSQARSQTGSVTATVAVFLPALLLLAGLVYDGVRVGITARRQAFTVAEQAARAGAQELDPATVRGTGPVRLHAPRAAAAANGWLTGAGATGSATATGTQVTVTVTYYEPTRVLNLIGIAGAAGSATATATPIRGISGELP